MYYFNIEMLTKPSYVVFWTHLELFFLKHLQLISNCLVVGKDNYPANLIDNAFEETAYRPDADITKDKPLNVGYYHKLVCICVPLSLALIAKRK